MSGADEETVARFVLRARRVEAHSLMRDPEAFARLPQSSFTVLMTGERLSTVTHPPPEDEEIFESLAARVRPMIVASEPIYYAKVLAALERLLDAMPGAGSRQRGWLSQLVAAWTATALGHQVKADDAVSDTRLAAGWMYADLVHANNANKWRKEALAYPMAERYAAGVSVFSRIASLIVDTLRLVEELHGAGVVVVSEEVWTTEAVVGVTEIISKPTAYIAPASSETAALKESLGHPDGLRKKLTRTDQPYRDPENQIRVELTRTDGVPVAAYDAAILHRHQENGIQCWSVLVADGLVLNIQMRTNGNGAEPVAMDHAPASKISQTRLAANTILARIHQAQILTFRARNQVVYRWALENPDDEAILMLRQCTEVLKDIVALEELTGRAIRPFTSEITTLERVRLRQIRLLWEGRVVQWDRALPPAVSPSGTPGQGIKIQPGDLRMGGSRVAVPEILIGHPEVTWQDQGPAPDAGRGARLLAPRLPQGKRFLAWSPSIRQASLDKEPRDGEPWDIVGLDQDTYPL